MELTLEELKTMAFALKDVRRYEREAFASWTGLSEPFYKSDNAHADLQDKLWEIITKLEPEEVA